MVKKEVRFFALTRECTTDWSVGRRVLRAFEEAGHQFVPETLYQWEDKIGIYKSVEQAKPYWAQVAQMRTNGSLLEFPIGLRWKRSRSVKYEAEVSHTGRNSQGNIIEGRLNIYADANGKADWRTLGTRLSEAINSNVAMMHCFASLDNQACRSGTPESDFRSFVVVNGQIPNIGWGMFFGGDFSKEVDQNAVSAAGFPIETIGNGYWVQVTEDINDVVHDFAMFSKRRAELKSLFREDLFLIKGESEIP
ncbi:hypothetical protein I7I49_13380 [Sinorhizobium meliloti]|uniref:hypothetical protein n=1 Tax=Rhizobium meliloti TaxID=382 RepID=UPI00237F78C7|nr:hypothetical protein [Sinorhizobium meliloti]MDE3811265.1 hypothetical protein [Sinorhizobium meliloti]